jgi:hypothetical protein
VGRGADMSVLPYLWIKTHIYREKWLKIMSAPIK